MNGAIWAYAHKPATIVQKMQFEHENRPTMIAFIGFLNQYKGMQLEYIDHDARTWLGYVMNLPFEETHISHANNAFEIEFEGVLQPYTISVADVIPPKT